jgi:hypothetical protein
MWTDARSRLGVGVSPEAPDYGPKPPAFAEPAPAEASPATAGGARSAGEGRSADGPSGAKGDRFAPDCLHRHQVPVIQVCFLAATGIRTCRGVSGGCAIDGHLPRWRETGGVPRADGRYAERHCHDNEIADRDTNPGSQPRRIYSAT